MRSTLGQKGAAQFGVLVARGTCCRGRAAHGAAMPPHQSGAGLLRCTECGERDRLSNIETGFVKLR